MRSYIEQILRARVYDVAVESPLDAMPRLGRRLGAPVWLKREDLQQVFSFKLRGAYNKLSLLSPEQRAQGVICASAGNHAQGVALASQRLGGRATIVMPRTTPAIKVQAVRTLGARVVLHGDTFDEAYAHAKELEAAQQLSFVHPYDDPAVIAGQGTIGVEILRQHPEALRAVFVPVGGGGLIAGVGAYLKFLRPDIRVIGVEPDDAPTLWTALREGRPTQLERVGIFADGVAVRQIGAETFRVARECVDEVLLVDTDEICAAIKDIFDDTRSIAEPAGALAVAGLKRYVEREGGEGAGLVAINSGANVNFDRLRHVAERAQIGEGREALLAVTIPEKPGSFRRFCQALGRRSVTEFNYRYGNPEYAEVFVGVEVEGGERAQLVEGLCAQGYAVVDMTDNEMAKLHVRYMVGGHGRGVADEVIYRFQFPERPGALLRFLTGIGQRWSGRWNITLFHYRNHGSDYGRVLAGVQVPTGDRGQFEAYLGELGYPYWDETDNPAYRLFLAGG